MSQNFLWYSMTTEDIQQTCKKILGFYLSAFQHFHCLLLDSNYFMIDFMILRELDIIVDINFF